MKRHRSAAEWAKLVDDWKRSGLTAREYGRRAGINGKTLTWWAWKLRRGQGGAGLARKETKPSKEGDFVAVQVVPSQGDSRETPVELEVGGVVVRVRRGFDRETLAEVLDVIDGGDEEC